MMVSTFCHCSLNGQYCSLSGAAPDEVARCSAWSQAALTPLIYFLGRARLPGLRNRTPPPFSSMNSAPAACAVRCLGLGSFRQIQARSIRLRRSLSELYSVRSGEANCGVLAVRHEVKTTEAEKHHRPGGRLRDGSDLSNNLQTRLPRGLRVAYAIRASK